MIEMVDRVPAHPGRVKLIPVPGQPDTYDMVRADDPIVLGTPINKALFDSIVSVAEATLAVSGWTMGAGGRYTQTVPVAAVKANSKIVIVDCNLDTDDADARAEIVEAWAWPSTNEAVQGDGSLTFYTSELPAVSIPIFVGVM
jgi:hypothetical protein